MKLAYLFLSMSLLLLTGPEAMAAARAYQPTAAELSAAAAASPEAALSKKELRQERRAFKKEIKAKLKELQASDDLILLVILAILLAPLAMYLYEGSATNRFWLSLVLWLLLILPGVIYTLYIILSEN